MRNIPASAFVLLFAVAYVFDLLPGSLVLFIVLIALIAFVGYRDQRALSPAFWIWAPWGLAFAPSLVGLVEYQYPRVSLAAFAYIITLLVLASVGFIMARHAVDLRPKSKLAKFHSVLAGIGSNRNTISALAFGGLLGAGLFAVEMIIFTGVNLDQMFELRDQYVSREVSFLSRIAPLLVWGSWVALAGAIIAWERLRSWDKIIWVSSPLAATALSVLSAGRQMVFQILIIGGLAALFRMYAGRKYRNPRGINEWQRSSLFMRVGALAMLVGAIAYMGAIAILRNDPNNEISKLDYLIAVFAVYPDQPTYEYLRALPAGTGGAIFEAIVYFSSGSSIFSGFYTLADQPLNYGKFTFPWIARRFEMFMDFSILDAMEQRRQLMRINGFMSHGWATAFSSYILDYGVIGCAMLMFTSGLLAGTAWFMFNAHPSFYGLLLVFAGNMQFFYTIMVPATSDSVYLFFLLGSLSLFVHERLRQVRGAEYHL